MIKTVAKSLLKNKIFIGLVVGTLIGIGFNILGPNPLRDFLLVNVFQPAGTAFLRGLFLIVVPLVLSSLVVGVTQLGSVENIRRLGIRLFLFYIVTTFCAIFIGQSLISVIKPGEGISPSVLSDAKAQFSEQISGLEAQSSLVKESIWPGLVDVIIPKNLFNALSTTNMLGIIFISLLFGIALLKIEKTKIKGTVEILEVISQLCIQVVGWIMKVAPYAVGALMITAVTHLGADFLKQLGQYIFVVFLGYCLQLFLTYGAILKTVIRIPLLEFYKRILPVISTAFSTSSSSATMPTTIRVLEKKFGVPNSITTFSVPLGTTINMDGTSLFEVIAALFVAQVFGVEITLVGHVTLVLLVLLTSIGVAGVPGGSIPILMSAMASLGIPPEGIAIVLGVDRILDMGRTVVNVTGDSMAALYLAKKNNVPLKEYIRKNPA